MTSSVLTPIEPVEPSTVTRRCEHVLSDGAVSNIAAGGDGLMTRIPKRD